MIQENKTTVTPVQVSVIKSPEPKRDLTKNLFEVMVDGKWTEVEFKRLQKGQVVRVNEKDLFLLESDYGVHGEHKMLGYQSKRLG